MMAVTHAGVEKKIGVADHAFVLLSPFSRLCFVDFFFFFFLNGWSPCTLVLRAFPLEN
jgi:hypothetical protein